MKKEYVAPKAMIVEMADDLMQNPIPVQSGGGLFSSGVSFMDFGGSTGGSHVAFN